jgi:UDP-N-acetylglucosamine 2-epimerase (non-hydrolysing)
MKKVLLVFGTRPEAIKMAPLVKEFQKNQVAFETIVCVTGQHREMLDQVLLLFEIKPNYDLSIMKSGQDLYDVTTKVLTGMREVLMKVKPDIVLVHGDTATSTAAALASFYQKIPVGHIEAGLRTHDIYSPWPEEMNRQITGRLTTYHFAPTVLSKQNLIAEGIDEDKIFVTGNTVIDALHWVLDITNTNIALEQSISKQLKNSGLPIEKLKAWKHQMEILNIKTPDNNLSYRPQEEARKLVLITGHRRENFGQGFINICEAIKELSVAFPLVDFVYPMHLNPNVRDAIAKVFGNMVITGNSRPSLTNTHFIEPLEYLPFVYLMSASYLVLTDSGGIQEEAPGLGKPVLVMRNNTERPEALEAGTVKMVGTCKQRIIDEVSALIQNPDAYSVMSKANNPYGDGKACLAIVELLKN